MWRRADVFSPAERAGLHKPSPRPWMTWLLAASILLVYLAQALGVRHHVDVVGNALAAGPAALAQHRYWTLLTYAWAHALPISTMPALAGFHLAVNVVPLVWLAPTLERRIGPWRLLALYTGGALAAAVAWLAFHPGAQEEMIGASGALFALIAAGGVLRLRIGRVDFGFFRLFMRLDLRVAALVLVALEAVQLFGWGLGDIAHMAHLGGALFGAGFALLLRARGAH